MGGILGLRGPYLRVEFFLTFFRDSPSNYLPKTIETFPKSTLEDPITGRFRPHLLIMGGGILGLCGPYLRVEFFLTFLRDSPSHYLL